MTFASLTDEQRTLDEAVGRLLAKTSSPDHVRAAEADGIDPVVWSGLLDMGVVDAAASGDASLVDLAVVARQCGAHLALVPFVDTVAPDRGSNAWLALSAAWLAGLARAVFELGLTYVKDRHQFGVPIGSFQTIQHRLADLHAQVTGAELLAHSAAVAVDASDPDAAPLTAMAWWWCGLVAVDAAEASLHFHGGYGFMLEYDVQLYVRRAKTARTELGDPTRRLVDVAERLWGEGRTGLDRPLTPDAEAFRVEVRAFLDEHLTDEIIEEAHRTGTMHDDALHRAIAASGYLAAGWPTEVGGAGRSAVDTTALMQELYGAGAPVDAMGIVSMVAATLVLLGNEEQRTKIVPKMLSGDALACLGYSEPDAGSDVAAVQTRAVRDGDEWVINGQKMFTTMAHRADYVFLLTRTSPDKPKHKGLTMFLVPMHTAGIEITPVHTLGGERTNITFYTDVRVPDSCRVGDVDAGWSVMNAALVFERNSANWGEPDRLVRTAAAWAQTTGALADPLVAERLARHAVAMEVGRLLVYHCAELSAKGEVTHVEGSMAKLFVTEAFTRAAGDVRDIVPPDAPIFDFVDHAYRHSTVTTIYGGSSEIQRGIIAEHGLGLPRSR
ncbi:MAG TPA: acyl-CoA dehydrogenase family protein [Acidimicrobiales bacterium]|nr:acyl-CoA dehydrogenase family protein [Acidimicrobiales bacterium]